MPTSPTPPIDAALPLGKTSTYPDRYDPDLLYPISRQQGRDAAGLPVTLPFVGWDLWRGYELSWLNNHGVPIVAILLATVPFDSPNIIESKSFKLYLNSLNQERFARAEDVLRRIQTDLSQAAGAAVQIDLVPAGRFAQQRIEEPDETCLDELPVVIERYQPTSDLLCVASGAADTRERLVSHLLKSNCPVTGQPDWASLHISYTGPAIDHASLLRYIVSYRGHQGFHEQCVEQIFCDIHQRCRPQSLSVYARYTRRGGLDINPWRATPGSEPPTQQRGARQ